MTGKIKQVNAEFNISLSAREIELLHHICSYSLSSIEFAKHRESSHYHGGVSKEEIQDFMGNMRILTDNLMQVVNKTEICR